MKAASQHIVSIFSGDLLMVDCIISILQARLPENTISINTAEDELFIAGRKKHSFTLTLQMSLSSFPDSRFSYKSVSFHKPVNCIIHFLYGYLIIFGHSLNDTVFQMFL